MKRALDLEYGAAELLAGDPLVRQAQQLGWSVYHEAWVDDRACAFRDLGTFFPLSGSKIDRRVVVYDSRWCIIDSAEEAKARGEAALFAHVMAL